MRSCVTRHNIRRWKTGHRKSQMVSQISRTCNLGSISAALSCLVWSLPESGGSSPEQGLVIEPTYDFDRQFMGKKVRLICESLRYIYGPQLGGCSVSGKVSKIGDYRNEIGKVRCSLVFYCYTYLLTHSLSHSDGQHGSLRLRGGKLQKCFTITINDIVAFRIPQSCLKKQSWLNSILIIFQDFKCT